MKVWDPLVRIAHWLLAVAVLLAWGTRAGWGLWHEWIGYVALAVALVRVAWGFAGAGHARFTRFLRAPHATLTYARDVFGRRERRYVGHNPLGGWMVVLLLALVTATGLSGWLYTTDTYWGVEWVETLHGALSDALMACIALHVAGVAFTSFRHRENLVRAMFDGRKREPTGEDIA